MGRKIIGLILLVALVVGGYYLWQRYQEKKELASGETHCVGCMTPEEKARFDRENSGDAPLTPGEHSRERQADTAAASQPVTTPAPRPPAGMSSGTSSMVPPDAQSTYAAQPVDAAPPATDSVPPNPANGMRFAGKGNYQWYRQGNLTYRVDTTTGRSCIIYATMEEWRKQIVLDHGCGRDA